MNKEPTGAVWQILNPVEGQRGWVDGEIYEYHNGGWQKEKQEKEMKMPEKNSKRARFYSELQIVCKCGDSGYTCPTAEGRFSELDTVSVQVVKNGKLPNKLIRRALNCETIDDGIKAAIEQMLDALPTTKRREIVAAIVERELQQGR